MDTTETRKGLTKVGDAVAAALGRVRLGRPEAKDPPAPTCTICNSTEDVDPRTRLCRAHQIEAQNEIEARREAFAKRRKKAAADWFESHCPRAYRDSDPSRLPDPAGFESIRTWKVRAIGLLIVGKTGAGKTRSIWALVKRIVNEGFKVRVLDSIDFQVGSQRAAMEGIWAWIDWLAKVDVLFLDDLGKMKFTERVQADLFGLIERRTSNLLPTIITTQLSMKELGAMITPDRRDAFLRRLAENFETRELNANHNHKQKGK